MLERGEKDVVLVVVVVVVVKLLKIGELNIYTKIISKNKNDKSVA